MGKRLAVGVLVSWLTMLLPATQTTEQDAVMAGNTANWHSLAEHFQQVSVSVYFVVSATRA